MSGAVLPRPFRPPAASIPLRLVGDERLAKLAAAGDQRAFTAIYERHSQGLYRYILSILRNAEDANDAVQGTMMKALLAIPAKRPEVPLRPWLYRIAHNEAISVQRRQPSHGVLTEDAAGSERGAHDEWADRDDLKQLVSDLLELPERQRAALVMRELSGLEYDEIGLSLGTSAAGAKQTVYEARIALYERAKGRELSCARVRRDLSTGDRRVLRGRRIAAHLRSCVACTEFQASMGTRGKALAALAPPLPGLGALGLLKALLGGGGGGGTGGGGAGLLAGVSGSGGSLITAAAAVKGAAAVAVVMVASGGVPLPDVERGGDGGSAWAKAGDVAQLAPAPQTARGELASMLSGAPRLATAQGGVQAVERLLARSEPGSTREEKGPKSDIAETTAPADVPAPAVNAPAAAPPSPAPSDGPASQAPAVVEHVHADLPDVEATSPAEPPSQAVPDTPAPPASIAQPDISVAPPETPPAVPDDLVPSIPKKLVDGLDGTSDDNGRHLGHDKGDDPPADIAPEPRPTTPEPIPTDPGTVVGELDPAHSDNGRHLGNDKADDPPADIAPEPPTLLPPELVSGDSGDPMDALAGTRDDNGNHLSLGHDKADDPPPDAAAEAPPAAPADLGPGATTPVDETDVTHEDNGNHLALGQDKVDDPPPDVAPEAPAPVAPEVVPSDLGALVDEVTSTHGDNGRHLALGRTGGDHAAPRSGRAK